MRQIPEHARWLEGLSPWPAEFGLERMRRLLAALGDPQRAYPTIHVVGTNGKGSTTLLTAALLHAERLRVGATISPHVLGWSERIQVDGVDADLEAALARVRPEAERLGATQFEAVTAAAFAEFAARAVDVAVVEAGLGGRLDATNVLDARVVVLTNVARDHTEVLGEPEWEELARANGAARVDLVSRSNLALAVAAAEAFLGRRVDPGAAEDLRLPGRLERRSEQPLEIWDGAHNIAGVGYLLPRLPDRRYVLVASILADKDVDAMVRALSTVGTAFVATASSNPRAVPAADLAALAEPHFDRVEAIGDPPAALARGRKLAGSDGALLVTGSTYLLADLSRR